MAHLSKRTKARLLAATAMVSGSGFGLFGLTSHANAQQAIDVLFSNVQDPNASVSGDPYTGGSGTNPNGTPFDDFIVGSNDVGNTYAGDIADHVLNAPVTIGYVGSQTYDAADTADTGTIWNSLVGPTSSSVVTAGSSFVSFEVEEDLPLLNSVGASTNVNIASIVYTEQSSKTDTVLTDNDSTLTTGTDGLPDNPTALMGSDWNLDGKECSMTLTFAGLNASTDYQFFVYGAGTTSSTGGEGITATVPSAYHINAAPTTGSTNTTTNQIYRDVFNAAGNPLPEKGLSWNVVDFVTDGSGNAIIDLAGAVPNNGKQGFINGFQIDLLPAAPAIPFGTWTSSNNPNTLWSSTTNWGNNTNGTVAAGVVPNAVGATAVFNASSTFTNPVVDSNFTVGGITFANAPGYTLAAEQLASGTIAAIGVLTLQNLAGSAAFINCSQAIQAINVPIVLGSNLNLISSGAGGAVISTPISGTGNLIVDGPNASGSFFTLRGSDSYSGTTTIDAGGLLKVQNVFAFPTNGTVGANVLNNGGLTIQVGSFASGTIAASPLLIGSLTGIGTLTVGTTSTSYLVMSPSTGPDTQNVVAGNNASLLDITNNNFTIGALNGSATLDSSMTGATPIISIGANGLTGTFGGVIQNSGGTISIVINGGGTELFTNSNTYSGTTTITSGTLILGGTAGLLPNGTAGSVGGPTTLTDNGLFGYDFTNNTVDATPLAGTGGVGVFGSATLTLTASNSGLSGNSVVGSGALLILGNAAAIGTGGVTNQGTVDLGGFSPSWAGLSGTGTFDNITAGGAVTLTDTTSTTITFGGVIQNTTGTVNLTLNGAGTQVLTGNNTYSGSTTILAGTLQVGNGGTLGSLGSSTGTISDGGLLAYDLSSNLTVTNNITGGGGVAQLGTGSLTLSGNNSFGGPVTVAAGGTLIAGSPTAFDPPPVVNNGNLVINAGTTANPVIIGTYSGTGTLIVGGSANGHLQLATNSHTSSVSSLIINPNSSLDVVNNTLKINFASPAVDPINTIVTELSNGYGINPAPTWSGTSSSGGVITSSTAAGSHAVTLGYLDGNVDTGLPAVTANQIVVKYTLVGDSDLSGEVDFTDLASVLKHFNQSGTDWAAGNFEYAANSPSIAATNFNDLADVLKNFLQITPGGSSGDATGGNTIGLSATVQTTGTQLPEPGSLSLVAAGAAGLLARRRRRAERA